MNLQQINFYINPVPSTQKLKDLFSTIWFWVLILISASISSLYHAGLNVGTLSITLGSIVVLWAILRRMANTDFQNLSGRLVQGLVSLFVVLLLGAIIAEQMNSSPTLYWLYDSDVHTWRPAQTTNKTAWGRSERVIGIHPVIGTKGKESHIAPRQVTTNLDKVYFGLEKKITLLITIPEPASVNADEEMIANSDPGGTLSLTFSAKQGGVWVVLQDLMLGQRGQTRWRSWQEIPLTLNHDVSDLRVSVSGVPQQKSSVGSTVWISVADVKRGGIYGRLQWLAMLNDMIISAILCWLLLIIIWNSVVQLNSQGYFALSKHRSITHYIFTLGLTLGALIMVPAAIWAVSDQSPFGGDQSLYALAAVDLYSTFQLSWMDWAREMVTVFGSKAPGTVWIGQLFVGYGLQLESINTGLLFSIAVTLLLALALVFWSLWSLSVGNLLIALAGTFLIANAPLFTSLSHHYLVEPLQLLSVAWFVFIMSRAPDWSRTLILAHLIAASSVAMLAKVSTPLYCLIPGIVSLGFVVWPNKIDNKRGLAYFAIIIAIIILFATTIWYSENINKVLRHAALSSAGPVAEVWGAQDTLINSLLYWLNVIRQYFFQPSTFYLGISIILTGIFIFLIRVKRPRDYFFFVTLASVVQISLVLIVFSLHSNRLVRFLLPLLPYVVVITSWGLMNIRSRLAQATVVIFLAGQFMVSSMETSKSVDINGKNEKIIQEIIAATCGRSTAYPISRFSIIAIDPTMKMRLAPAHANYVASREHLTSGGTKQTGCKYGYIGDGFFGDTADKAWASILRRRPNYIILADPDIYPPSEEVINQTLNPENFSLFYSWLQKSELYEFRGHLESNKAILIYQYRNYLVEGRSLSDRNEHTAAVALLEKAAILQPENAETWANLQLALLRSGNYERSINVGQKGLILSPIHPYILLNMGLSYLKSEDCSKSVLFLKRAALQAPDEQFRIQVQKMLNNMNNGVALDSCRSLHEEEKAGKW